MSIHRTEPERALGMIDSALAVGNITWQRAEYLKAVTQYGGLHNIPQSRQTCLDLIKREKELLKTYLVVGVDCVRIGILEAFHCLLETVKLA